MGDRQAGQPKLTPDKVREKSERADRLAQEMRRNLIKRKQQQRAVKSTSDESSNDSDGAR